MAVLNAVCKSAVATGGSMKREACVTTATKRMAMPVPAVAVPPVVAMIQHLDNEECDDGNANNGDGCSDRPARALVVMGAWMREKPATTATWWMAMRAPALAEKPAAAMASTTKGWNSAMTGNDLDTDFCAGELPATCGRWLCLGGAGVLVIWQRSRGRWLLTGM